MVIAHILFHNVSFGLIVAHGFPNDSCELGGEVGKVTFASFQLVEFVTGSADGVGISKGCFEQG